MRSNQYLPALVSLPVQRVELRRGERRGGGGLLLLSPLQVSTTTTTSEQTHTLAARELDEINHWARLVAVLYFCWFILMLAANGLGMAWLFARAGAAEPRHADWLFVILTVLDLGAAAVAIFTNVYMTGSVKRVAEVLAEVTERNGNAAREFQVQSPLPAIAIQTAFWFTVLTLGLLSLFWFVMAVWGDRTGFFRV
ncbi:MAG TPA: hypothetical protein VGV38_10355 [Pyrinomonadaceae bacterium]|nr:hypothetical protein [Pyrinomonadaceae bacterium]